MKPDKARIAESIALLRALQPDEGAHREADALLLDVLHAAALDEVVDAYLAARKRCGFWVN